MEHKKQNKQFQTKASPCWLRFCHCVSQKANFSEIILFNKGGLPVVACARYA